MSGWSRAHNPGVGATHEARERFLTVIAGYHADYASGEPHIDRRLLAWLLDHLYDCLHAVEDELRVARTPEPEWLIRETDALNRRYQAVTV